MNLRLVFCTLAAAQVFALLANADRPLMRDFMGLCGHTVTFKPALYSPVTSLVRDYHPLTWDVGDDTGYAPRFPMARNGVNWAQVYGSWIASGHRPHACIMFDELKPEEWKDLDRDAFAYGKAFAAAFGPGAPQPMLGAAEIGNEPGLYDDASYRRLFEAMARGIREADPKMRIATCAANLGPSGRYSKSMDLFKGLESLYDIINFHLYAEIEGWPTWRRSYPEDPKIKFREHLRSVLAWRRENVPEKEVWLTEFGWDATTKPSPKEGDFARWEGSTETQQAQWIVRAWMLLAREGVDRAYLYFFNDDDTPHVHGSSGLTRNFDPKPAFHAVAWMQRSLGDYRFSKVLSEDADVGYAYEFTHGHDPKRRVIAAWKPDGAAKQMTIPFGGAKISGVEKMPLTAGPVEIIEVEVQGETITLEIGASPIFVTLN